VGYLKDQEMSIGLSIMGLNDASDSIMWERKIAEMKGVLILSRMIQAIPRDAREKISKEVEKEGKKGNVQ
jgi:hypothetical protein